MIRPERLTIAISGRLGAFDEQPAQMRQPFFVLPRLVEQGDGGAVEVPESSPPIRARMSLTISAPSSHAITSSSVGGVT